MAANGNYSTPTSAGGVTISQDNESAIRQQIDQLVQEADRLRQLLRDCENPVASSSEQNSHPQTTLHPQILTAESTLVNSEHSAFKTTSMPQSGDHFLFTEDRTEYPSTPSTAFFGTSPMSPFTVEDDTGSDSDETEHHRSRSLTFPSSDGHSTPVTHPRSAPEAAHGSESFPLSRRRTRTLSNISHLARASNSTPFASPRPRHSQHWESPEERLQYRLLIDVRRQHCFIREHRFNRSRAVRMWGGEPYTKETIPWPIDIDNMDFSDILDRALSLHAENCDRMRSSPTECPTCMARITVKGILTRVLNRTLNTGQSIFDIRDRWNPDDDWLSIAVYPMDQHFVRRGMLLVYECTRNIIEWIGAPDPTIWRMSTQAVPTSSQRQYQM